MKNNILAIIPAAGTGERFNSLIPKQYSKLNGRTIIEQTISTFLSSELISKIIITINKDDNFIKELMLKIPDMVYIYSQNSASSFLNFIKINQSESLWMNTNLMCIGEKTSSILNEIKWKKIFLFNPGEEEFLLYKI